MHDKQGLWLNGYQVDEIRYRQVGEERESGDRMGIGNKVLRWVESAEPGEIAKAELAEDYPPIVYVGNKILCTVCGETHWRTEMHWHPPGEEIDSCKICGEPTEGLYTHFHTLKEIHDYERDKDDLVLPLGWNVTLCLSC